MGRSVSLAQSSEGRLLAGGSDPRNVRAYDNVTYICYIGPDRYTSLDSYRRVGYNLCFFFLLFGGGGWPRGTSKPRTQAAA